MSKALFAFFLFVGLLLLYLTVMLEYQFIAAGFCP